MGLSLFRGTKFYKKSFRNLINSTAAEVSTEGTGDFGVMFYRNDLLGKRYTRCAITTSYHRKTTKFLGIYCHHLWKC